MSVQGPLTFLFTDIEGSTRLWEQHSAAMRDALAQHDRLLRASIDRHAGRVFSTSGDGLVASFTSAHQAAAAAVDAGVVQKLDPAIVTNLKHLYPEAVNKDGYGATLFFFAFGIAYRKDKLQQAGAAYDVA